MPSPIGKYLSIDRAREIYRLVSDQTNVAMRELTSDSHEHRIVSARWRIMRLMRDEGASLPMIGRRMQLHHSTVLHGLRQLERRAG